MLNEKFTALVRSNIPNFSLEDAILLPDGREVEKIVPMNRSDQEYYAEYYQLGHSYLRIFDKEETLKMDIIREGHPIVTAYYINTSRDKDIVKLVIDVKFRLTIMPQMTVVQYFSDTLEYRDGQLTEAKVDLSGLTFDLMPYLNRYGNFMKGDIKGDGILIPAEIGFMDFKKLTCAGDIFKYVANAYNDYLLSWSAFIRPTRNTLLKEKE